MTPYEAGFDAGERAAYRDRQRPLAARRTARPDQIANDFDRGWWDGYTPRNRWWGWKGFQPSEQDEVTT